MLEIKTVPVGMLQTNCYLVFDRENRMLYIIDPGAEPALIAREAGKFDYREAAILLTHAHVDHISAVPEVKKQLGIDKVYLHSGDLELYRSPANAIEPYIPAVPNLPEPNTIFSAPGLEIIELPGHTEGGVGFYFPADKVLFSGDTLFAGSVGRTDLPGGSWAKLLNSIRTGLLTLPGDVKVYPGHDCSTTIDREKNNPCL